DRRARRRRRPAPRDCLQPGPAAAGGAPASARWPPRRVGAPGREVRTRRDARRGRRSGGPRGARVRGPCDGAAAGRAADPPRHDARGGHRRARERRAADAGARRAALARRHRAGLGLLAAGRRAVPSRHRGSPGSGCRDPNPRV
ncbi:MAG: hypothetical protein AVDCRST_MAG34-1160, partial [uncultured Nocardioidaceae bacterium]